jgi:acyl-coenzyme A synthetase/AMP-(fatty) acid ligase
MTYSIAQISNRTLVALNLAELIDYHLEHNPYDTFTVFPGESVGDEPSRISFLEFGRASHRFARAIYPDAPVKEREVVGIVVNADSLMWITALAGIVRAGATVSLLPNRQERSIESLYAGPHHITS